MATGDRSPGGWQLDASAPAAYEEYLVPKLFGPGADALCDLVGVAAGDRVVDVGCGTGVVARRAAGRAGPRGHVSGVDINAAMIEHAGELARRHGLAVDWRQADAADLPYDTGWFNVALAQQVLQFVTDPATVLAEIARVLERGGTLGLSVLRSIDYNPGYVELAAALERHAGAEAGAMMRSPFSWPGRDELHAVVTDAGFRDLHLVHAVAGVRFPSAEAFVMQEAASSPLAGPLGALADAERAALVAEVDQRVARLTDDDGVVFPVETYLLSAIRR